MIIQLFAYAEWIIYIIIVFALIFFLFFCNFERTITSTATDKLGFFHCRLSGNTVLSVTGFIKAHDIKKVKYIPTLI